MWHVALSGRTRTTPSGMLCLLCLQTLLLHGCRGASAQRLAPAGGGLHGSEGKDSAQGALDAPFSQWQACQLLSGIWARLRGAWRPSSTSRMACSGPAPQVRQPTGGQGPTPPPSRGAELGSGGCGPRQLVPAVPPPAMPRRRPTGFPAPAGSRYLWTDAFGVCNYITLAAETGERRYLEQADALITGDSPPACWPTCPSCLLGACGSPERPSAAAASLKRRHIQPPLL